MTVSLEMPGTCSQAQAYPGSMRPQVLNFHGDGEI